MRFTKSASDLVDIVLRTLAVAAFIWFCPVQGAVSNATNEPRAETPVSKLTGAAVKTRCADLVRKFKDQVKSNGPLTAGMYQIVVSIAEEVKTNLPDGDIDSHNQKVMQDLLALWTTAENSDDGMKALIASLVARNKRLIDPYLQHIGLGIAMYARGHQEMMPPSLDVLVGVFVQTDGVLTDPASGNRFVYIGQGKKWDDNNDLIVAYSPIDYDGHEVLFNNGSVQHMGSDAFTQLLERQTKTAK